MPYHPAGNRCEAQPGPGITSGGRWFCSLERGHRGEHQAMYGHDYSTKPAFTWKNWDDLIVEPIHKCRLE